MSLHKLSNVITIDKLMGGQTHTQACQILIYTKT